MATPLLAESASRSAPYVPFRTFLNSLDALSRGVPPRIDRTIWRTQSGVNQGLIMNAYRFLGLVDDNDKATNELRALASHPEKRPQIVRGLIDTQYKEILQNDLTKMTPRMLDDAFEVFAVRGATKRKAVTFFLQAVKFADIAMSPFLIAQTRNTSGLRRRRIIQNKNNKEMLALEDPSLLSGESAIATHGATIPGGSTKTIKLRSGGTVTLIASLDVFGMGDRDREFVFSLIDRMREYEQDQSSSQKSLAARSK